MKWDALKYSLLWDAIVSHRWPLMIDPQLQGIKWIKNRYGDGLVVVRIGQKGYLDTIERAISAGDVVLIENIEEEIDPVLDPVLGRNTIKKGWCNIRFA